MLLSLKWHDRYVTDNLLCFVNSLLKIVKKLVTRSMNATVHTSSESEESEVKFNM